MTQQLKWDFRFMGIARSVATWSKDPSTKIGAVIVNADRHIVATGYNGFPSGLGDDFRLEIRDMKYPRIIHAEMNAILQAGRDCIGSTLYMWGMEGAPCTNCTKHLIQAGIKRVVAAGPLHPEPFRVARVLLLHPLLLHPLDDCHRIGPRRLALRLHVDG